MSGDLIRTSHTDSVSTSSRCMRRSARSSTPLSGCTANEMQQPPLGRWRRPTVAALHPRKGDKPPPPEELAAIVNPTLGRLLATASSSAAVRHRAPETGPPGWVRPKGYFRMLLEYLVDFASIDGISLQRRVAANSVFAKAGPRAAVERLA